MNQKLLNTEINLSAVNEVQEQIYCLVSKKIFDPICVDTLKYPRTHCHS